MRRSQNDHSIPIKDLFAVYRARLQAPQASVVKEVVVVVKEVTGFAVTEKQFSYNTHTKTITIQAPSVLRSELQFHKTEILTELRKRLGDRSAPTTLL